MGMKTTKVAVAAILIALLAVGTGYALTYEGKTVNTNNTSTVTYITIGGDANTKSFSSNVYYDTHNEGTSASPKITFTLNDEQITQVSGVDVIELGEIILAIEEEGETNDYTITIEFNGSGTVMEGTYYVVFSEGGTITVEVTSTAIFKAVSGTISKATESVTATLYVAVSSIKALLADDNPVAPQPLNKAGFDFIAEATTTA